MDNFPIIIRYKDDNRLAVCLTSGDIHAGRAFTILATGVRIIRKKR